MNSNTQLTIVEKVIYIISLICFIGWIFLLFNENQKKELFFAYYGWIGFFSSLITPFLIVSISSYFFTDTFFLNKNFLKFFSLFIIFYFVSILIFQSKFKKKEDSVMHGRPDFPEESKREKPKTKKRKEEPKKDFLENSEISDSGQDYREEKPKITRREEKPKKSIDQGKRNSKKFQEEEIDSKKEKKERKKTVFNIKQVVVHNNDRTDGINDLNEVGDLNEIGKLVIPRKSAATRNSVATRQSIIPIKSSLKAPDFVKNNFGPMFSGVPEEEREESKSIISQRESEISEYNRRNTLRGNTPGETQGFFSGVYDFSEK